MRIRRDAKKYAIIPSIKRYINYHDILRDYETEEQMPMYYRFEQLDCLDNFIDKDKELLLNYFYVWGLII